MWLGVDGGIYSHGSVLVGDPERLYQIGVISETSAEAGSYGCILFGGASTDSTTSGFKQTKNGLYLFYTDSSAVKHAKEWDMYGTGADGVISTQVQGDVFTLVKYLPSMSTVNYIDIYLFPLTVNVGSTTAGTIKVYFNQSSTAFKSEAITQTQAATGFHRIELNKPFVTSIQLEVEFNTAITVGAQDLAPSIAVVNYEPTDTKG